MGMTCRECRSCGELAGEDEFMGTPDGLCFCCTSWIEPPEPPINDFYHIFGGEPDG